MFAADQQERQERCIDRAAQSDCEGWKRAGFCIKHESLIYHCKKTCNLCSSGKNCSRFSFPGILGGESSGIPLIGVTVEFFKALQFRIVINDSARILYIPLRDRPKKFMSCRQAKIFAHVFFGRCYCCWYCSCCC